MKIKPLEWIQTGYYYHAKSVGGEFELTPNSEGPGRFTLYSPDGSYLGGTAEEMKKVAQEKHESAVSEFLEE